MKSGVNKTIFFAALFLSAIAAGDGGHDERKRVAALLAGFPLPTPDCGRSVAFGEMTYGMKAGMLLGASLLRPYLELFESQITGNVLEIGPYDHPLMTSSKNGARRIFYWEKDLDALGLLRREFSTAYPLYVDLRATETELNAFADENRRLLKASDPRASAHFDAFVISQVLNYVDFRQLLRLVTSLAAPGALMFINDPLGGAPRELRHPQRPRACREILQYLEELGYEILEYEILTPALVPRLLAVARFRG